VTSPPVLTPTALVTDPHAPPPDAELRAHLERVLADTYELERELGRGGMGVVYRAKDRRLKRAVAVKVLPPELGYRGDIRQRFLREAETAAQLTHPNIVPIYSVDERDGLVYFVMALVEGDNLAQRIAKGGAVPPEEARRLLREVADALAYAHARHVVHRDIKPDNILLDGGSGRPLVTDFGIARAISEGADSRLTATGIAIGTPAYMSPEQSAGDKVLDGRTDLYALGVVAYQMLCGELPFIASSTPAMLVKHLSEVPTPVQGKRAGIPDDLAAIVMCLLEKDPADRFESAEALMAALDGAGPVPARTGHARAAAAPWTPTPLPGNAATVDPVAQLRWHVREVVEFRKKLAPYLIVNGVILALSVFTNSDFLGVTALWTVYMAFQYAKLWSAGYDWRDVFRQSRDRLLLDVVTEWGDDMGAWFDPKRRDAVRAKWQARQQRPGLMAPVGAGDAASDPAQGPGSIYDFSYDGPAPRIAAGPQAERLRQALQDRDEVRRLHNALRNKDRKQLQDLPATADALVARVQALALAIDALDRRGAGTAPTEAMDAEIAALEAQANPFDREASEARVRRLAQLKRARRAAQLGGSERSALENKLDDCLLALQNLRYDLVRLTTGSGTTQHVTLVAAQAMSLADDVDALVRARERGTPS
jgi:eukaryotic-like serine/threonine-protein kinase